MAHLAGGGLAVRPYLAWVTFAATLNASISLRNRGAAADKRAFPANARKG